MVVKFDFSEIKKRRTLAIISHPDAGKTTLTEKFLLISKVIHTAGTIKAKKSKKYAMSDWMKIEQKRGISITTSVIQIPYCNYLINLLDTPGHKDFSEDTYRILTAVDCCIMVIDAAKGIEERTKKLINVTRIHSTPIITFINKLDRNSIDFIRLLDLIESELKIRCVPITWPIGNGSLFKGIYSILDDIIYLYSSNSFSTNEQPELIFGLNNSLLDKKVGVILADQLRDEIQLVTSVYNKFSQVDFLKSYLTPIFFGSALKNIGIKLLIDSIISWAPYPRYRLSNVRKILPFESKFSGFVFKIQANMDLKHRDRIAFLRIVSGKYQRGMSLYHVRMKRIVFNTKAFLLSANNRILIDSAYSGDIIGLQNHGNIRIGDSFTEGEQLKFFGIPSFSPDIFRKISLKDPLKQKNLLKGLFQLSEEGAIQVLKPVLNNDLILGAIGELQLEIVIERLKLEYNIEVIYHPLKICLMRWVFSDFIQELDYFKRDNKINLAFDINNRLVYLTSSEFSLNLIKSRYPKVVFSNICDN